jgi:hypothetical protein
MLRKLQKYEKQILFGIVIFVALGFGITWQMLAIFSPENQENIAGEIMGKKISRVEFQTKRQRCIIWTQCQLFIFETLYRMALAALFQPPFDMLEIEEYTKKKESYLDKLTWLVLILEELSDKAGIKVSPQEVKDYIKALRVFYTEDGFSYERYQIVLSQQWRLSEVFFEDITADFLKINKYRKFLEDSIVANTKEVFDDYLSKNEEIKIQWVAFDPQNYLPQIQGRIKDDEELIEYYQQNASKYEILEKVQIEYIMAATQKIQDGSSVISEEAIQNYYNKNREKEFATKSFIEARDEIHKKLSDEISKDRAIERITRAEEKITLLQLQNKKVDLKALSEEFKLDYKESGLFSLEDVSEMEKELGSSSFFQKQVSTTDEGEISSVISTDKGHFIFRLIKKSGNYIPKFTDRVKERVKDDFIRNRADEIAKSNAQKIVQNIVDKVKEDMKDKEDDNLKYELRRKYFSVFTKEDISGSKPQPTSFFNMDDTVELGRVVGKDFKESLFKKEKGEFGVIEDTDVYYVLQVIDRRPAEPSKFDTEKERLERELTEKKKREFIKGYSEELKKQVNWKSSQTK